MARDVWEHVDGTTVQPDDADARAKYEKARQKAMTTLVMGIHSNLIYLVTSCVSPKAKELWDTLKTQFQRDTLANNLSCFSRDSQFKII